MKKRALLVGINYEGTGHALKGCINDSKNMNAFLSSKGFTDVKMILEKEATTAGIKAGLEWLVSDLSAGDVIVFHYSGHGSQLPSATEADGFEEIICPIDLDWLDKVITDDTLRQIFNKVPRGVNTTVILDCCHSGTMLDQTESMNADKTLVSTQKAPRKKKGSRFLKPPAKIAKKLADRSLVDWQTSRDVNQNALLIAGCHANQTSADAMIDGQAQGAATAAMLKSAKNDGLISYKQLVTKMREFMVQNKFTQVPQLDGSPALYDNVFLNPLPVVAEPAPAPVDPIQVEPVPQPPTEEKKGNSKLAIVIGFVVVLILIAFFAG